MKITILSLVSVLALSAFSVSAQEMPTPSQQELEVNLKAMRFRCIGPYRAGRSLAVAAHPSNPLRYYFGTVGGGVFRSDDGGDTWVDITDTTFTSSSIGCLAIAPSDPNVLYAGTGETDIRGNISTGDGMYRSTDAGKTWKNIGLNDGQMFADIVVHPTDPNWVMVSAMGHIFGTNTERGIFKSTDAGGTWKRVLFRNDSTGGMTLKMDPLNPRIIYASLWQAYRNAWSLSSGGSGSGVFKSTDGGDTWKEISKNPGLPTGVLGKICVDVSKAQPGLVFAMVENANGGLFKSNDHGNTWQRVSTDADIKQRPWYFSHVYADPIDANVVYVLNVQMHKSIDGGKTFSVVGTNHADHHDLWIDPTNNQRMIVGNDGGAVVSVDGGSHWTKDDMATAQFYHVDIDSHFPYRIYGAQQDNTTISIPSRIIGGWHIDEHDWYSVAGFESGYVVPHPTIKEITVGGNYSGYLGWQDRRIDQERDISVYPKNPVGEGARDRGERFQWTFPVMFSPQNPSVLYTSSQHVFKSTNNGSSWQKISTDLTKNDSTKQVPSGGPITKDNTGVEVYNTVFSLAESTMPGGPLWAGSDCGLVHVSTNAGQTWANVTPTVDWSASGVDTKLGKSTDAVVSCIEPSPFDKQTAYVTIHRYKLNDEAPYIYKTTNNGSSWKRINSGIPDGAFVRVLRCDPFRKGLLYAGTERGLYVSFDDGARWTRLRLNLPLSPIRDLRVHPTEKDLVVATHGRSFWVLDDLTPLHQYQKTSQPLVLYTPRSTYRVDGGSYHWDGMSVGENAPNGALIYYRLADTTSKELVLTFRDSKGDSIITFSTSKKPNGKPVEVSNDFYRDSSKAISSNTLTAFKGLNKFEWNLRFPGAEPIEGTFMWGGNQTGPKVIPGTYTAEMVMGSDTQRVEFMVTLDPRVTVPTHDIEEQFRFLMEIRDTVKSVHKTVKRMQNITSQISVALSRLKDVDTAVAKPIKELGKTITDSLATLQNKLVQNKAKAFQDLLNYPVRLNNKIASLFDVVSSMDAAPTQQSKDLFVELSAEAALHGKTLASIESNEIQRFNTLMSEVVLPAVILPKDEE